MKQRKKILTVRGNADDFGFLPERESKVAKYTQDTLHMQLPVQFQQVWELYRILRMQPGQQQSQSSPNSQ